MRKLRIGIALLAISMVLAGWIAPAQARVQSSWSEPYRLSSEAGMASEGYLVADQYGYVHCFWTETLFENQLKIIKYARFDGTTWTKPNDINVTSQGIRNVTPFVDQQAILHIACADGPTGSAYNACATANNALSAQNCAKHIQTEVAARPVYLRLDCMGVFHLLCINPP